MAYKAEFKTAYLQREVHGQYAVSAAGKVGYLYSIGTVTDEEAGTSTDTLTLLTTAPAANTRYALMAQSDMTMGNGHVPVEKRDYRYDDSIAASTSTKDVAFYIVTIDDINYVTV
jgi:hypothetical protein